jgi:hypothetical protein
MDSIYKLPEIKSLPGTMGFFVFNSNCYYNRQLVCIIKCGPQCREVGITAAYEAEPHFLSAYKAKKCIPLFSTEVPFGTCLASSHTRVLKPHCIRCSHFKVDDISALEAASTHCWRRLKALTYYLKSRPWDSKSRPWVSKSRPWVRKKYYHVLSQPPYHWHMRI